MSFIDVASIRPHDNVDTIHVRVIRKWIPYGSRQQLCYLFIDKHGNAIEAIADLNHKSHFDSCITLQSCYTVTEYISDNARHYMNVVPHTACIKLGLKTTFVPFHDTNIPFYYFNFVSYDQLRPRLNNHFLLTDFIGRMEKVSNIFNVEGTNMLKINLQDQSGKYITATIWEEIAFSFDRETALQKPQPVILAMTSMKVSEYKGTLQLGSTNATTIVINPDIEDLQNVITRFEVIRGHSMSNPTTSTSIISTDDHINKLTLEEVLQRCTKENQINKFTCFASIQEIDRSRNWYYKSCTECKKKVLPKEKKYACPDHGVIQSPRYMYVINATITDTTSAINVVLFNDVVTALLGIDCKNLLDKDDVGNPCILPETLKAIEGRPKLFELMFKEGSKEKMKFTVNKVLEPINYNNDVASTSQGASTIVKQQKTKRNKDAAMAAKKKQRF